MYTEVVSNAELKVFTVSAHLFTVKSQQSFIYTTVDWGFGLQEKGSRHPVINILLHTHSQPVIPGEGNIKRGLNRERRTTLK